VLRAAGAATAPLRLELGPPATFHPVSPVVYLAVGGDLDGVVSLRQRLLEAPFPTLAEKRAFVPHVTLDQRADPDRIGSAMAALADYRVRITVFALTLLEQSQEVENRPWHPVADAALGAVAVIGRGGLELEVSTVERLDPLAAAFADAAIAAEPSPSCPAPGERDERVALVARRAGAVVGTAECLVNGPVLDLSRLVVAGPLRGEGIGSHLLAAVEHVARVRGCAVVRVIPPSRSRAEAFFSSRGYVFALALAQWRHGADHVVMSRSLRPGDEDPREAP
jgi:GNAT superfamily N-acetyltransferase